MLHVETRCNSCGATLWFLLNQTVQIHKLELRLTACVLYRPDEQKPERCRAGTINLTNNFDVQLCRWGLSKRTGPGVQYCEEDRRTALEKGRYTVQPQEHKAGLFPMERARVWLFCYLQWDVGMKQRLMYQHRGCCVFRAARTKPLHLQVRGMIEEDQGTAVGLVNTMDRWPQVSVLASGLDLDAKYCWFIPDYDSQGLIVD